MDAKVAAEAQRAEHIRELEAFAQLAMGDRTKAALLAGADALRAEDRAVAYERLINADGSLTTHEDHLDTLKEAMHFLGKAAQIDAYEQRAIRAEAGLRQQKEDGAQPIPDRAGTEPRPLCGFVLYGPPAICTCGTCDVNVDEMEIAQEQLDALMEITSQTEPPTAAGTEPRLTFERCEGRYQVPVTREEPFEVTYRCGRAKGHTGPHATEDGDMLWKGNTLGLVTSSPSDPQRSSPAGLPLWLSRLGEIEWSASRRAPTSALVRCCPVCHGVHPDGSIEMYGHGTRLEEGHRSACWLHLALINEDAPAMASPAGLAAILRELKVKIDDLKLIAFVDKPIGWVSQSHAYDKAIALIDQRLAALITPSGDEK